MKVINEWGGEPKRTPTQVIRDWYAEYRSDIEECGIDGFHATELMAALAPLFAAGPWRTDVENAEIGQTYWCFYGEDDYEVCSMNMLWQWRNQMNAYMPPPKAFAAINQPEIDNVLGE